MIDDLDSTGDWCVLEIARGNHREWVAASLDEAQKALVDPEIYPGAALTILHAGVTRSTAGRIAVRMTNVQARRDDGGDTL